MHVYNYAVYPLKPSGSDWHVQPPSDHEESKQSGSTVNSLGKKRAILKRCFIEQYNML